MKGIIMILALCFLLIFSTASSAPGKYEAIFNFGDSLSDTGNFLLSGAVAFPAIGRLPYGETFFRRATGRCSDGRLIIDFIAEAFGLPYLQPYLALAKTNNYQRGVNFAVAGATVLDSEFFYQRNVGSLLWTNDSLSVQLGWFKEVKSTICRTRNDCGEFFAKSLFVVGEIGGNDFNYQFFVGGTIQQLEAQVPLVVGGVTNAVNVLIEEGAKELVVPGNLPIGCSAVYLTIFGWGENNKAKFDRHGCLKGFNSFAKKYNNQLKAALEFLRHKYPNVKIIYADYYGAAMRYIHAPLHHGLSGTLKACCGGGGPYNFNNLARCGHIGSTLCPNPSVFSNWDGIHLTEAAYRLVATSLLHGPFTTPPLSLH